MTFNGQKVPRLCSACHLSIESWHSKGIYEGEVVHYTCVDLAESKANNLADRDDMDKPIGFDHLVNQDQFIDDLDEDQISEEDMDACLTFEQQELIDACKVRQFDSGATRDTDEGKLDYEAFLSPLVLERYAQHLHKHRVQSDGTLRDGDNWQKGIPKSVYMKSMWRHFMAVWSKHRSTYSPEEMEEDLCSLIFNAMGYLHELLKEKK